MALLLNNQKIRMAFTDWIPDSLNVTDILGKFGTVFGSDIFSSPDIADAFEAIEFAVDMLANPIVSLWVNPQTIRVNKQVLANKQLTKGGFVIQFWGHDLESIQVTAETGYFGVSPKPLKAFELFKDYCYQKRFHSKYTFKGFPIITMLWAGQAMRGYFQNLNYQVTQQRPYIITYDFTFIVTELITIPVVSTIYNLSTLGKNSLQDVTNQQNEQVNFLTNTFGSIINQSQAEDFVKGGWGVKLF